MKMTKSIFFYGILLIGIFYCIPDSFSSSAVEQISGTPSFKEHFIIIVPGIGGDKVSLDNVYNYLTDILEINPAYIGRPDWLPQISLREKSQHIHAQMNIMPDSRVIIIAHSLGGIVTEDFLITATDTEIKRIDGITFINATLGSTDMVDYALYSLIQSYIGFIKIPIDNC